MPAAAKPKTAKECVNEAVEALEVRVQEEQRKQRIQRVTAEAKLRELKDVLFKGIEQIEEASADVES